MLLWVTDGLVHVWIQDKNRFAPKHIQATLQDDEESITIRGCISDGYKLDLVTMLGTVNEGRYCTDILYPNEVLHIDNHPLRNHPVYMEDNTYSHRAWAVVEFLQQ